MVRGLIAAAGLGTRLGDLADKRNKVLLDLGGESLLSLILTHFELVGVVDTVVVVGFDAAAVRQACGSRARCILNPFFERNGILGSLWLARPFVDGQAFVFTVGDHYFAPDRFQTFLVDQPTADVLVDVDMKPCDEEDMKVYLNRTGKLRTMSKAELEGPVLGEFTGAVRFSAEGSTWFFDTLEKMVWQQGIDGYVADVLCQLHRKWELAFHLSVDHRRVEVDFPRDLTTARHLYAKQKKLTRKTA
jgi:choline kinase